MGVCCGISTNTDDPYDFDNKAGMKGCHYELVDDADGKFYAKSIRY